MDAYRKSPNVIALGKKLGMSPDQAAVAFDVANFLVLALGVCWLIAKILPKTLRERNETIQKDLVSARTATEEARTRLSSVEERLGKLDSEIAALRTRSEQDSASEELRIKATVEDEKKKILASAEQEIAAATTHAQKQLQQYAAGLAIEQAARKLVVSAETDRLLVQGFAQRLAGDGSKKGQN
jgi:F-type H+-transporting ATPase subunit b